jgi:hypothetical protein
MRLLGARNFDQKVRSFIQDKDNYCNEYMYTHVPRGIVLVVEVDVQLYHGPYHGVHSSTLCKIIYFLLIDAA